MGSSNSSDIRKEIRQVLKARKWSLYRLAREMEENYTTLWKWRSIPDRKPNRHVVAGVLSKLRELKEEK